MTGLSYTHIIRLTLEAIFQVFVVCVFGYIAARCKILTPQAQRHIANLNVFLFTPCLIFSKLASSLSLQKMVEVAIIPLLFVLTTGVSFSCAKFMSWVLRLNKNESNFVTAMGVFGNSNSLPVSLTMALAYTLPNLSWDQMPNDNPDQVASRGILYLLIFQQLGQIVRWSWGYNTLLRPEPEQTLEIDEEEQLEVEEEFLVMEGGDEDYDEDAQGHASETTPLIKDTPSYTPILLNSTSENSENSDTLSDHSHGSCSCSGHTTAVHSQASSSTNLQQYQDSAAVEGLARAPRKKRRHRKHKKHSKRPNVLIRFAKSVLAFMNPPLWAMLTAIIVASVPALKYEFFESNDVIQGTLTKAIQQLGSVAIPLILVVLGSNLSPDSGAPPASKHYGRMVFGAIMSRMILPAFVLLPIIAMGVKYSEVSILDDPIFLLVSFILTIAPPAIQLSQICQLNGFYEKEMAGVLFWGYVVLTLPTTLFIVVSSLEVLDWAGKLSS